MGKGNQEQAMSVWVTQVKQKANWSHVIVGFGVFAFLGFIANKLRGSGYAPSA